MSDSSQLLVIIVPLKNFPPVTQESLKPRYSCEEEYWLDLVHTDPYLVLGNAWWVLVPEGTDLSNLGVDLTDEGVYNS